MKAKILLLFIFLLPILSTVVDAKGQFTVVIDAGHGGHDTGAVGAFSQEKNINLNVALIFGQLIEKNLPNVRVIYTRTTDVFIPLHERADVANRAKADLFISIHTNSLPAGRIARGFQVYTLGMHRAKDNLDVAMRENSVISMEQGYQQTYQGFDPKSSESYIMFELVQTANMEKSVELAKLIQRSVCAKAGRQDKGVHQAGFLVLRETSMPSCLIELGFISTEDEEQFLNTPEGLDLMARGIYEAFVKYKNMYDDHIVIPYRAAENKKITVDRVLPPVVTPRPEPKPTPKPASKPKPAPKPKSEPASKPEAQPIKKVEPVQAATPRPAPAKTVQTPATAQTPATVKKDSQHSPVKVENVPAKTPTSAAKPAPVKKETTADAPVFKVQICAVANQLAAGSGQLKGHKDVSFFQENNYFKYTIGETTDYNEITKLRNSLQKEFPQAFVVAFKNGKRMALNVAVAEFRNNKKK